MHTRSFLITTLCLFCLGALPCRALVEVEDAFWLITPDGDVSRGAGGEDGTTLDVQDDLGFKTRGNLLSLRVVVGDRHQGGLAILGARLSGDSRLDRDIRFRGDEYPAGTRLSSDLDGAVVQGFYRLNLGSSFVRGGAHVGLQYMDFNWSLDSEPFGKESEGMQAVMPVAGLFFLGYPNSRVGMRSSIQGSAWDLGDVEAAFVDIELALELNITGGLYAAGGYRFMRVKASDEDLPADVDLILSGPILYLGYEW